VAEQAKASVRNPYWSPEEANLCRRQRLDVNRFKRSISGVGLSEDNVCKAPKMPGD
jgi:hypothetical protein